MSEATTLRDGAGMQSTPNALADSTLIPIDCQNTYRRGVMQLSGVEQALVEAQKLLKRARAFDVPIIHIQHDGGGGATATRALPTVGGKVIPAQTVHEASLAAIGDLFGVVVDSTADVAR